MADKEHSNRGLHIAVWLVAGISLGLGFGRLWFKYRPSDLPQPARESVSTLPSENRRADQSVPLPASPAEFSPGVALEELRRRSVLDGASLAMIARSWSRHDPRAALAWIETLSPGDAEAAWSHFVVDARQLGLDEAFTIVNSIASEQTRAMIAARVSADLAGNDYREAIGWAERFPAGPLREQALGPAIRAWAHADPVGAIGRIASMEPGKARTDLLSLAVGQWCSKDREAAFAWVRQLPAGNERDAVVSSLVGGLVRTHPAQAVESLGLIDNASARRNAIREMTLAWAPSDPAGAAAWVDRLSDPAELSVGRGAIGRQWAVADLNGCAEWLASLPSGPSRDAAIEGFISWADGYDAAKATAWASAMEDPKLRERQTRYTFGRWAANDAAAAKAWLQQASVSDELRAELRRIADNGGIRMPSGPVSGQ